MASKWMLPLCFIAVTLFAPLGHSALAVDTATVADLSTLQQQNLLLKISIERLKLQQELQQLTALTEKSTQDFCQSSPEGLGDLSLSALYTVNGQHFASLTYPHHTTLEASRGDYLLCGEIVLKISRQGVELEKQGQRYQLLGVSLPRSPTHTAPLQ